MANRLLLKDPDNEVIKLADSVELNFGSGSDINAEGAYDVQMRWDGTDFDVLAGTDDYVIKFGNGTKSFDIWVYGNTANDNIIFDASGNELAFDGIDVSLEDSDYLKFGDSDDVTITWDGTNLVVTAAADDSVIEIGDAGATQKSFDLKIYGDAANGADYVLFDASASRLDMAGAYALGKHRRGPFTAKTTDYTVTAAESGTIFTTRGAAGAVNFTLPAVAAGLYYEFINLVDQNMTITADTADTLITFNDTAADSVSFSTASEKIGARCAVFCDGTNWFVSNLSDNTMTVTT